MKKRTIDAINTKIAIRAVPHKDISDINMFSYVLICG
jgi:hypothetical protein